MTNSTYAAAAVRSRRPKRRYGRRFLLLLIAVLIFVTVQKFFVIPKPLQDLAARNPETIEFVLGYGARETRPIDLSEKVIPGQAPHFLQWDKRWGYEPYGGDRIEDMIGLSGCGPTCLSMVTVALTGDLSWNPAAMAQYAAENGYYVPGSGTAWALFTEGTGPLGITGSSLPLDQNTMIEALDSGSLLIASVGPGDFTEKGHFIVLDGWDGSAFQIKDPNSRSNTEKTWTFERLAPQIVALWELY